VSWVRSPRRACGTRGWVAKGDETNRQDPWIKEREGTRVGGQ
jgi:hypothetical protein